MSYWLMDWLDNTGIKTSREAELALKTKSGRKRLIDAAFMAESVFDIKKDSASRILAGHSMDLSGQLMCGNPKCLKKNVDDLLGRVWHYFDEIIVNGLDSKVVRSAAKFGFTSEVQDEIWRHVQVALYVREIGASDSIRFVDKPYRCPDHVREYAEESGYLAEIVGMTDQLRDAFSESSRVINAKWMKRGEVRYEYTNDCIDIVHLGRMEVGKKIGKKDLGRRVSDYLARRYAGAKISDHLLAREIDAPLADVTSASVDLGSLGDVTPGSVAFNLQLPMMESVPVSEIFKMREEYAGEYQLLKAALRKGIEERIKALPGRGADVVADSVYDDLIQPEVVRLQRKMDAAADAATRRYSTAAVVGSVMTTVGLSAFAPIAATGVAVGATAAFATYYDWLKDRKEVETSDLHFLLRLDKVSIGHASGQSS